MTQTMIEANEIRMALGEGAGRVEALKGINLTLAGGELTLLMGPSGSGKTTLLSVLGCMLSPTSGSVNIRGRAIPALTPKSWRRSGARISASSFSPTICFRR